MRLYEKDRTVVWCRACGQLDRWRDDPATRGQDGYLVLDPSVYVCTCGAKATHEQARTTDAIRAGALQPVVDETQWPPEEAA